MYINCRPKVLFSTEYRYKSLLLVTAGLTLFASPCLADNVAIPAAAEGHIVTAELEGSSSSSLSALNIHDIESKIDEYPNSVQWMYRKYGRNTLFYQSKLQGKLFAIDDIQSLIYAAYRQNNADAALVLSHTAYSQIEDPSLDSVRDVLESATFLRKMFKLYPKLIAYYPNSQHKNYLDITLLALDSNLDCFKFFPLRYKVKAQVLNRYFTTAYERADMSDQANAMNYASKAEKKWFLSKNGLLLQFLSERERAQFNLVYTATLQNSEAIQYADPKLQALYKRNCLSALKNYKAQFDYFMEIQSQRLEYLSELVQVWLAPRKALLAYYQKRVKHEVNPYLPTQRLFTDEEKDIEKPLISTEESDPEEAEETFSELEIKVVDNPYVRDLILTKAIEEIAKRPIQNLWSMAKIDNKRELYLVNFMPKNKTYLSAFAYRDMNREETPIVLSFYHAVHSYDGQSIWRYQDKGEFKPTDFDIKQVLVDKNNKVQFVLEWLGKAHDTHFKLTELDKSLHKSFIQYDP